MFQGGYCSADCGTTGVIDPGTNPCGSGGACLRFADLPLTHLCMAVCDPGSIPCRPGYDCVLVGDSTGESRHFCLPPSVSVITPTTD
jgi:hypothetical protein